MGNTSRAKYAKAISDRSGMEFPYNEMVKEWNGSFVHVSEYEAKHPQLQPKSSPTDGQGLVMQDLQEQNLQHKIYYQEILLKLLLDQRQ